MHRRRGPELTDDDLRRLVRLGGGADRIAEAAGLDVVEVRHRLDRLTADPITRREDALA